MITDPQAIIFMGRSAAGKGTQASLLIDHFKKENPATPEPVFYIETGARFRDYITQDNYSSGRSKMLYTAGDLQPAFIVTWLWTELIVKNYHGDQHWVVDGTPRSLAEAFTFDSALRFYGFKQPTIILLDIHNDVAHDRLNKRGRADDLDHHGNEKRLAWFESTVMPAVEYFRSKPDYYRFITVDGAAGIEEIHRQVVAALS